MQNVLARLSLYKARPINKTARNVTLPGEARIIKKRKNK